MDAGLLPGRVGFLWACRTEVITVRTMTVEPLGPLGRIGLGCMGMSAGYDPASRDDTRAIRVIWRALDLGMNLIDTADVYGPHANEQLVGKALMGRREQAVLATKVGLVIDSGRDGDAPRRVGRPEHVRMAIDASLRRLGTDHVDLWQLHRVDPEVPLEETWGAMAEAVVAGKVLALGLSEVSVAELRRAGKVHPVTTVQSELSLWTRGALTEVLPYCAANGILFIPFCPLGRGYLTGRFASAHDLPVNDARHDLPRFQPGAMEANQEIVARVREVAAAAQASPAQVALAWLLALGPHVLPIPGTANEAHLEENAAADSVHLSALELARLNDIPAPTGSRY
jgi:aryl-alcohol dehydrogenase-like predicted oxidoreductase